MVEVSDANPMKLPVLPLSIDFKEFRSSYDKQHDTLFLYREPKRPGTSLDIGGHLWLRFDPDTLDILGFEIENFEQVFLVRYPELGINWKKVKSHIAKRAPPDGVLSDYLRLLLEWLKTVVKNHPTQIELPPAPDPSLATTS